MSKGRKLGRAAPARRQVARPERSRILVVGEGRETEPNYFDGLKREDVVKRNWAVTVKRGPGKSPETVIAKAIEFKQSAESQE